MSAPEFELTPTAEHIDAVARVLGYGNTPNHRTHAKTILTSTDPAVHAAMRAALVRAGVVLRATITAHNATVGLVAERLEVAP